MGTLSDQRRAQMRDAARIFRKNQAEKGLYQATFWMTHTQASAVREWLYKGGDVSVFSRSSQDRQEDQ